MINWGILGMGRMGMSFANAINETSNSKLIATASNSGKVFGNFENRSYESLINDKRWRNTPPYFESTLRHCGIH